ncbi:MAG: hypothetical protein ISR58_10435 [Anaerolineales bacterium]|nr:hypothetical protein [Chloroflexota bacterium]MBL6981591.1 hypothetical protein [Anaerolineales bacterium]
MKQITFIKSLWPTLALFVCLALMPSEAGYAQGTDTHLPTGDLVWTRTGGPLGGLGYDVRMRPDNPDIMYVTDAWAGVHMSTDGGQSWFPSNEGITTRKGETDDSIPIFCLTIDQHNYDIIWVGTEHAAEIFKSTDGGYNWQKMTNNIAEEFPEGLTFRGLTVHPESSEIVFAAAEWHSWANGADPQQGREFEKVKGIVYRTMDGGQTWKSIWRGDSLARYVWINPHDPDIMYISTGIFDREAANSDHDTNTPGGEGILKSTDGGITWEAANNGLTNLYVGTLFMHPEDPDVLLAAATNNAYPQGEGVFLTEDGAATWQKVLPRGANSVEFSWSNPDVAYAGNSNAVARSQDRGRTWEIMTEARDHWGPQGIVAGWPIDFQIDPRDENRIFANNYGGGNFLSEDGGRSWEVASAGYTGAQARAIAVSPADPARVFVSARSGLFLSSGGGDEWIGLNDDNIKMLEWNALAIDPANPQHILAAAHWEPVIQQSYDGGLTWAKTNARIDEGKAWGEIEFAPSDSNIVYAGAVAFRSAGSTSFELRSEGIYVSRDGGATWNPANDDVSSGSSISGLAIDHQNPDIVYAAASGHGLLKTVDGGNNWLNVTESLGANRFALSVAIHPANPEWIFAGVGRAGLYVSNDGGASWSASVSGLVAEAAIVDIHFDPTNPTVIYIADRFSGVYRSTDGGQTWQAITEGLRTRVINQMDISSDGLHLYAATEGEGVFRLDLNGQSP